MNPSINPKQMGIVYIVGAGPGDKKLITVKGLECLQKADVVIYDLLLNDALLEHCPQHTEKIKTPDPRIRSTRQDEINHLLIKHAQEGKVVVRLKGGDPFIFGRGGEEAMALVNKGIPYEVVPGITSAIAASAYAGIPVTHRDFASSVAFVTGHSAALHPDSNINWEYLAKGVDTLVVYMGVAHLKQIVERLIGYGRDRNTPVSLIRVGTTPQQSVIQGTLVDIVEKVETAELTSPAIIVVGEVNRLREHLRWFDTRPLFGKRILVTRARAQASVFAEILEANGAEVIQFPTIEIRPLEILSSDIPTPEKYDWVIFTSVNAVEIYNQHIQENGLDSRAFSGCKICAIGPKTVEALKCLGISPDFIPSQSRGTVVAAEIDDVERKKILLPRAKIASDDLPKGLKKKGAIVDDLPIYDTVKVQSECSDVVVRDLLDGRIDCVTFTSSSTVTNFLEMFPNHSPAKLLEKTQVAVIGASTESTALQHGLRVDVVAVEATIESLAEAIIAEYI